MHDISLLGDNANDYYCGARQARHPNSSGGDGLGAVFTCSNENIGGREGEGSDSGPHGGDIFIVNPSVCNV